MNVNMYHWKAEYVVYLFEWLMICQAMTYAYAPELQFEERSEAEF